MRWRVSSTSSTRCTATSTTAPRSIDTLKGWKHEGYRGPIEIDPQTRDVIQDEHAEEVIKKPDGKLGVKVLETIPQVKDECKVLKVGRCAS